MESPEIEAAPWHEGVSEVEPFSFVRELPGLGRFGLRRVRIPDDVAIVHRWVSQEYARYWGLFGQSVELVEAAYRDICHNADVYLGFHDGEPAFLVECYEPSRDAVGKHYRVQPGDRGMHVLVAPPVVRIAGFTSAVFGVVMDFLFSDPNTARVVVEPDIRNSKIHALNRRAGFRYARVIDLPSKTAHLAFCTREQYCAARDGRAKAKAQLNGVWPASLDAELWRRVNAELVCKAISELAHERLLQPERESGRGRWHEYVLTSDRADTEYRFRARVLQLNHWNVASETLKKTVAGQPVPVDALDFVLDQQRALAIPEPLLPVYLEEITSTLYAAAYKHAGEELNAADLVHAEFQEIECAMTAGHPAFIANSGRVGFDAQDYLAYAPETGAAVQLIWLAAHRRYAEVSTAADLSYERLIAEELGASTIAAFERELERQGLDPQAYLFIPVHPWQWFNRLNTVFAADLAERDLVCLGFGTDSYRAQQSIRTFFNSSQPHKRYVKTALSVLNMGFMRGLSADYMRNTPAINDWIKQLIDRDPYFAARGFGILREVAGFGYDSPRFAAGLGKSSPYRKMLAALFRESPLPYLQKGQRLMTMAALLHRDREGAALLPQLIQASGLGIDTWLDRYLDCYLAPLLHCFYRHDLAFMPHGENVILVLKEHVPVAAWMKDIAEEAVIMDPTRALPERVARIRVTVPDEIKLLSIFTDVFDGILRYMAPILLEQADYSEERFWRRVAACLASYRHSQPDLAAKFARHDLFAPEFMHSCLNRLQLRNNQQMVDLADPAGALQFAGTLVNPVAAFRDALTERANDTRMQAENTAL